MRSSESWRAKASTSLWSSFFEDLHWIDNETQAFLNLLVDSIATARVLLLINYRPEYRHEWSNKTYYTQLRLDPLGKESADEMLSALLGDSAQLGALKRLIIEKTEGNPFFMEEMVQVLLDEGAIARDGGAVRLTKSLGELKIPQTVQAILAERIDRLAPDHKDLLQTLAVVGTEFRLGLVRRIAAKPESDLEPMMSELQMGEFIYEQPAVGDIEYTFKHALTHHVAYHSVLNERRRYLHRRIGEALESAYSESLDDHVAELALHYARGGDYAKALRYCLRALRQCADRGSTAEALTHFEIGLEQLQGLPDDDRRAELELDLRNSAYGALADSKGCASPEVENSTARAMELCERPGINWVKAWTALYGIFFVQQLRPDVCKAEAVTAELVARAEEHQSVAHLAEASTWAAYARMVAGDFELAERAFERASALLESMTEWAGNQASSLAGQVSQDQAMLQRMGTRQNNRIISGWNLWFVGYPDRALERIDMATAIAQEPGAPKDILCDIHGFASYLYEICRQPEQMRARAEARLALATESGFLAGRALSEIYLGWADAIAGDLEGGIARMRLHLSELKAARSEYISDRCLSFIATALGRLKRFDEALVAIDESFQFMEKSGQRYYEAELHRLKGELLLAQDAANVAAAESCFRTSLEVARRQHARSWKLRATTSLARLMRESGRRDEARTMLTEIYNWFTEGFQTADLKDAAALLDELGESAESILQFWFATERSSGSPVLRARWFASDPEFDQLCKARFLGRYEDAAGGRLDEWRNEPRSCLALVLVLDQLPRNMFRGTARAFATDAKARELSRHAIASGFDRKLSPSMRFFFHLPLEHSEDLADQSESLRLTGALVAETGFPVEALKHAEQHLETIRRFGRFPGRNDAVGTESTQDESDFLKSQAN